MTTPNSKWYVRKIRINQGGYTDRGYEIGLPIYKCWDGDDYHIFLANDRNHAIKQLRDTYKGYDIKLHKEGN